MAIGAQRSPMAVWSLGPKLCPTGLLPAPNMWPLFPVAPFSLFLTNEWRHRGVVKGECEELGGVLCLTCSQDHLQRELG